MNIGKEGFSDILKTDGTVALETGKHVYALQEKQVPDLHERMVKLAETNGWKMKGGHNTKDLNKLGELEVFLYNK